MTLLWIRELHAMLNILCNTDGRKKIKITLKRFLVHVLHVGMSRFWNIRANLEKNILKRCGTINLGTKKEMIGEKNIWRHLMPLKIEGYLFVCSWGCIQSKTWCMGPYAGVDENPPYLIVSSVFSYPPPSQRERGGVGKISPIGWAHLYLSANFYVNSSKKKGEERGESWTYVFE